ncbi:hypothetical protein AJ80_05671 [Polytolypa hystricis UAMH7299]|uniref:Uncharacterized protein n=1 Tax=Polytolypa hystricis (strain UAMH7299) TaxID=1447883 RepID=A0A2B7Y0Q3_POLH7|nr:hypothetical protein AJ80_05671 [Polytolypa hystricis UAMH7299]
MAPHRHRPSLCALPAELRILILKSSHDGASLKALVHASPAYHHAYTIDRRAIFSGVILNHLHRTYGDAHEFFLALHSTHMAPDRHNPRERIIQFLSQYWSPDNAIDHTTLSIDDTIKLMRLEDTIRFLARDFSAFVLEDCPASTDREIQYSASEMRRFARAVLRWHIHANLFGHRGVMASATLLEQPGPDFHIERFYSLFHTWEIEEMISLHNYVIDRYYAIIRAYKMEHGRGRGSTSSVEVCNFVNGLFSLGPLDFAQALRSPTWDFLWSLPGDSWDKTMGTFVAALPLEYYPYHARHPTEENRAWLAKKNQHFHGDDRVHGPNWGWIVGNKGKVEVYYALRECRKFRRRGYVFWDKARIERNQALLGGCDSL